MRIILTIFLIIAFNFSAFAQIDTSEWEGKTVLVVIESRVGNYDFYQYYKKEFQKNWYLTDSVQFVVDTLINRDLNSFGKDTVIIAWKMDWDKIYTNRNCFSSNPYDCLMWILIERFEFKNFQSQNWETYVFLFPDEKLKPIQKFQTLITKSAYVTNYTEKTQIIKNGNWSKEIEILMRKKIKNIDSRTIETLGRHHTDYQNEDAIYIYKQRNPSTNYLEIIDLQTNRVIEKIELSE
jgi:hypothetical protein